ncbi:MAG: Asp-tRNA(Asn)/Glu-tRNA(Gln) amidotransferase subunit GatC [Ruminococcus sp.]|nr:Asp-tRNA(Asn)/Glu-tRNA(Gln) amidotransferase subunit GatC [Ruminococcus sp.]
MQIDKNLVMYLEKLGRIELSEEQRAASEKDLQDILTYMDTLNELDTDGVEPASHSFPVANVQRDDVVTNAAQTEAILQNAPNQKDGCFVVPKTVE